jgi:c-di-GMP-binding flagellar brake protein YcgR
MQEQALIRRRSAKRYGKNGSVTLRRDVNSLVITGSLFDLSTGGCLVWLDWPVIFTPTEFVEVKLQTDDVTFRLMGTIRHTSEEDRLIGVEFLRIPQKEREYLEQFIVALLASVDQEEELSAY